MANTRITGMTEADALTGDELLEVSQLSSTVTITASTISALASDNSYNDSGNGFVTAGFAVGMRVNVAGFTGNAANNIFVGVITALTAGKMTIGGTDGDVIVDDAAGETVTITTWETHRTTAQDIADLAAGSSPTESIIIPCSDETTALVAGSPLVTFRMPYAFTATGVRASLTDAAASGTIEVDIEEGGVSIFSTTLTIDAGDTTSVGAGTPAVISDASLADDAELTINLLDDADGTATGLKVTLIGHQ